MQDEAITGTQAGETVQKERTTCCIVGAGPCGAMLALLLARKGVDVTLLEAHLDFDREFRGDTFNPAALMIMDEVGILDRLLKLPHSTIRTFVSRTASGPVMIANFSKLKVKHPYLARFRQSWFLEIVVDEAKRYPNCRVVMGARAEELLEEQGKVVGVRYRAQDGFHELRADLTVGADGRFSRMRKLTGFKPITASIEVDVLWFRLSWKEGDSKDSFSAMGKRLMIAFQNRIDHWQIGYVIHKGGYKELRAAGLDQLRQSLATAAPELADRVDELQDWKQVSVLSVEADRLPRWHRPGLLLIGDAAHVMSPVTGAGINCAIQDAVVTANKLAEKLKAGTVKEKDLAAIQKHRQMPTIVIQRFQDQMMKNLFLRALNAPKPPRMSLLARFVFGMPFLRDIPSYLIGVGPRTAHVK